VAPRFEWTAWVKLILKRLAETIYKLTSVCDQDSQVTD